MSLLEVEHQCRCRDQCCLVLERPEGDWAPPFSQLRPAVPAGMRAPGDLPHQGAGAVRPLLSLTPFIGNLRCALETFNHLYLPSSLDLTAFSRILNVVLPAGQVLGNEYFPGTTFSQRLTGLFFFFFTGIGKF